VQLYLPLLRQPEGVIHCQTIMVVNPTERDSNAPQHQPIEGNTHGQNCYNRVCRTSPVVKWIKYASFFTKQLSLDSINKHVSNDRTKKIKKGTVLRSVSEFVPYWLVYLTPSTWSL